jgi:DNA-binding transcriptional LysR family regulator
MPTPTSRKPGALFERKGLSLDRLHVLVQVDDAGSLIDAARGDEIRASQFCRQLRELDKCLGVRLTRHAGRKVVLTDDGAALAGIARESFRRLEDFLATREGRNRDYTLAAGESLLQWIVVPGLAALSRRAPEIGFKLRNLQNSDIVLGLEELSLDFGVLRKESLRAPLKSVLLGQVSYVLCVPKGLCAAGKKPDAETALKKLPLAVHLENTYVQGELEAQLRGLGITPRIMLRCDTFPNAMAALRTGAYATLMILLPGVNAVPDGVEVVPLPFLDHTCREIHLAWNPRLLEIRPDAEAVERELSRLFSWQDP